MIFITTFTTTKKFIKRYNYLTKGDNEMDNEMKKFQIRIYHDEGFVMVEVSKINDINTLMTIVNFLERLRE